MRRISLIIFGAIALLMVGYYINNILQAAGVYRELAYEYDGTCLTIEGVIGAEDIQIDHQTGLAYISNQDRRKYQAGTPEPGFIAVLNMAEPRPEPVRLDHGDVPDFYPHGISLYRMDDGGLRLFVISHPPEQPHRVEIFDVADGTTLTHIRTVEDDLFISPNDLVAVGPEAFYYSNDHGSRTELGRMLEDVLRLPRSNLGYFDGQSARIVAEHMRYANGVNVSEDGKTIYSAEITGRTIRVFDRNPQTGELMLRDAVAVNTLPDNIDIAPDGSIWVGAHPKIFDFVGHASDPEALSPSEVFRLIPDPSGTGGVVELVYLQDGSALSGSSVAAQYGSRFLIGAVFDPRILMCSVPTPKSPS